MTMTELYFDGAKYALELVRRGVTAGLSYEDSFECALRALEKTEAEIAAKAGVKP